MKKLILMAILLVVSTVSKAEGEQRIQYEYIIEPTTQQAGYRVYSGGGAYGAVRIPATYNGLPVLEIGTGAFSSHDITSIVLPSSIITIADRAFENCADLVSIDLGRDLKTIGEYAFQYNTALKAIALPDGVQTIGNCAFFDCTQLEIVDFGESLTTIGEYAFRSNTSLKAISLPNSMKSIEQYAFWNCLNLEQATLGNSLVSIGDYVFQHCKALKNISLPNSLESVGDHFLCDCKNIESLVIPQNLTSIGTYFLHGCEKIRKVVLLGDVPRTLGEYPFLSQTQEGNAQVTNCVFYVDNEDVYKRIYQNGDNWKYADQANRDVLSADGTYWNQGNSYNYVSRPSDVRIFEAQWVTACYPYAVDARAIYGDNALVAIMDKAQYVGQDATGDYVYHIDFKIVESQQMEAHTPYLLKADPKNTGSAFIVTHTEDEQHKTADELSISVDIDNQHEDHSAHLTQIKMLGTYAQAGYPLQPGEILFSNNKGAMKFYKQTSTGMQRNVPAYRCYWQIVKDNQPVANAKMGGWGDDTEVTGIKAELRINHGDHTEVYNLRGQLMGKGANTTINLPAGIYIVNGKKTQVK